MTTPRSIADFHNTRWSLVAALQEPQQGQARLDELCIRYWVPVQACFADRGFEPEEAVRMTRGFFDHLVREGIARAAEYGRFRLFLLDELERYVAQTQATQADAAHSGHDEQTLRQQFAIEVIALAMRRLRIEADEAGRQAVFERLQHYLSSEGSKAEHDRDAAALGVHPLFVVMAVRRLRQRFRQLVDEELAEITRSSDDYRAEREAMREALERAP
ncbi:hypothetical protein HIV01_017630 [Lysobacter arenosi]|uniref:Sigma-70 family RNA polymerase sigma factor n=1 Tax=Lysobacter arenosi TaxID=2795387 RepID=A0ABX7R9X0_9GAMM|nr:hypothetical protein [Lysobacter arenosi]QSX74933.1 hypothetical protein HIV01_017630 [Lysobacter arenosi]